MPIEMYGETWFMELQISSHAILYMAGCETARGVWQWLNRMNSMKHAEVINTSSAAN